MGRGGEESATGQRPRKFSLLGVIASAGFGSGHRFVVGHWSASPLGAMSDVMWATPDGRRRLLATRQDVAEFVSAVYRFDDVVVTDLKVRLAGGNLDVHAGELGLEVHLGAGRGWRFPFAERPPWFTRLVEAPVARAALGVHTYGVSSTGVREWYRADRYRPVTRGWASLGGRDLGRVGAIDPPAGFGFTEPPRRPSMVWVRPLLHDPSGTLDRVVARWAQA